jgi:glycine/sarcosine N-methyltransferase
MYDEIAADYDRFVNWENRLAFELPFIEKILRSIPITEAKPMRILDAACGTGKHAIALAEKGFTVSAADISEPMIEQARANAAAAHAQVEFKTAGFLDLSSNFQPHSFDVLLCLGNSLPHVLTQSDLISALKEFGKCLRVGGTLLLQNRNFDAVMASRQRWMEPQEFHDDKHEWLFMRFYDFETNGLIHFNMVSLKRPRGGEWRAAASSTWLAPQKQSNLHRALQEAGFTQIVEYGSMTGESYDPMTSGNLIVTAAAS